MSLLILAIYNVHVRACAFPYSIEPRPVLVHIYTHYATMFNFKNNIALYRYFYISCNYSPYYCNYCTFTVYLVGRIIWPQHKTRATPGIVPRPVLLLSSRATGAGEHLDNTLTSPHIVGLWDNLQKLLCVPRWGPWQWTTRGRV